MKIFRSARLMATAAILTGVLVAWGPLARAGTLEMLISDGTTSYVILDNGPVDTNPNPNQITALASVLVFPDFNVVGLNAYTNNPGTPNPTGAVLTVGGALQRTGSGIAAVTITTTDTDYMVPRGSSLAMHSTTSATFTDVPTSSSSSFQSWFNPSNPPPPPPGMGVPSPPLTLASTGLTINSAAANAPVTPVGATSPYGLTNEVVLLGTGIGAGALPDVVFAGSTQILSAVPEPDSLSLLVAGLPLAIWGWIKRRRLSLGS